MDRRINRTPVSRKRFLQLTVAVLAGASLKGLDISQVAAASCAVSRPAPDQRSNGCVVVGEFGVFRPVYEESDKGGPGDKRFHPEDTVVDVIPNNKVTVEAAMGFRADFLTNAEGWIAAEGSERVRVTTSTDAPGVRREVLPHPVTGEGVDTHVTDVFLTTYKKDGSVNEKYKGMLAFCDPGDEASVALTRRTWVIGIDLRDVSNPAGVKDNPKPSPKVVHPLEEIK